MGNSDNSPNDGKLSLDTSAPLWSAILTEVSKGEPIAQFKPPDRTSRRATVDAFTGLKPGPFTTKTINEFFVPGTVPTQKETLRIGGHDRRRERPAWQDGCVGTEGHPRLLQHVRGRGQLPAWQKADALGRPRGARLRASAGGPRARGRRTSTRTRSPRSADTWGAPFMPRALCPIYVAPPPSSAIRSRRRPGRRRAPAPATPRPARRRRIRRSRRRSRSAVQSRRRH